MKTIIQITKNNKNSFGDQEFEAVLLNDQGVILDTYYVLNHEGSHESFLDLIEGARIAFNKTKVTKKQNQDVLRKVANEILSAALDELEKEQHESYVDINGKISKEDAKDLIKDTIELMENYDCFEE